MATTDGKVVTADGTSPVIGFKIGASNGSANDAVQVMVTNPGVIDHQTFPALGNANGAIAALTSSANTTQAEFNALRDATETLADDFRALRAKLITAGVGKSA
jgi:hypothetical protein